MKRQLLTLLLAIVLVLCSCTPSRTARKKDAESTPDTVHHETSQTTIETDETSESTTELHVWIIKSAYGELGEFSGISSSGQNFEENYIENALKSYAQDNYISLRIHYSDVVPGDGPMDLLILGSGADLQYYLSDEKYVDLTPYFEQDQIYSNGQYVEPVLRAGLQNDQQLTFPLIFNMFALYTSEESLARHRLDLSPDASFAELVSTFTSELNNLSRPTDEVLLMGFDSMPALSSVFEFFLFAGGASLLDSETETITLDLEYFEKILPLYEAYICNNWDCDRSSLSQLSDNLSVDYRTSDQSKWYYYSSASSHSHDSNLVAITDQTACFIDIDSSWNPYQYSSFIAQAAYYESRYRDQDETFMCIGIPEQQGNSYAARVSLCGLIPTTSKSPDESYKLLKYLADTPVPWYLGASINRQNISATMQFLTEATIELPIYESEPYYMQPMSQETATYLTQMIDQVHTVYLPLQTLRMNIEERILSYLETPTMTPDELYKKIEQGISLYLFWSKL